MSVSARVENRRVTLEAPAAPLRLGWIIAVLAVATLAGLLYAFTSVRSLDLSYQLSKALKTQRQLRESSRRLLVELNHLRAPERLEREAQRLGLAAPRPEQIRRLK